MKKNWLRSLVSKANKGLVPASPRRRVPASAGRDRVKLAIEQLEDRSVPAVLLTYTAATDDLTLLNAVAADADTITATMIAADTLEINLGAATFDAGSTNDASIVYNVGDTPAMSAIATINISGAADPVVTFNVNPGDMADTVNIVLVGGFGFAGTTVVNAGLGNDIVNINETTELTMTTVNGGDGDDTIGLGTGDLDDVRGAVTVNGDMGTDTVTLFDQTAAFMDTYTITDTTVARAPGSFAGLTYGTIEGLTLNSELGPNPINIASTAMGTPVTINNGGGADVVTVAPGGSLDTILASVTFNGGGAADTLIVNDSMDATANTYTVNGTTIGRMGGPTVTYNAMVETLTLNAGTVANTINVTGTVASAITINGGAAADNFVFSDGAALSNAASSIAGGGGIDTLDYSAWTAGVTVNLGAGTASNIRGGAAGGVAGAENIIGGTVGDVLTGDGLANTLTGNGGADMLDGGAGADMLDGGLGDDTYIFGAAGFGMDTITADAGGAADVLSFTGPAAITANLQTGVVTVGADTVTVTPGIVGTIETLFPATGGGILIGQDVANTWLVNGPNAGNVMNVNGTVAFTGMTTLNGGTMDDDITFDFTAALASMTFNGGAQATESMTLMGGGPHAMVNHTFTNETDGSVFVSTGAVTITYTGLMPIMDTLVAGVRTMTFSDAAETITLSDDGMAGDGESMIDSDVGAETLIFANPTAALIINVNTMAEVVLDTVNVTGLDSTWDASLTINGGGAPDVVATIAALNISTETVMDLESFTIIGAAQVDLANVSASDFIAVTGTNIDLNGTAYTSTMDDVTFTGAVDLDLAGGTTTITSGGMAGDDILITGAVDDDMGGDTRLVLDGGAAGNVDVMGAVGAVTDPLSFTATGAIINLANVSVADPLAAGMSDITVPGTVINLFGGVYTAFNGDVTLTGTVELELAGGMTTIASGGLAGQDIVVIGTIDDGMIAGDTALVLDAGATGAVTLVGDAGAVDDLGAFTVLNAAQVDLADVIAVGAIAVTGTNIDLNDMTYTSTAGAVTFTGTVDLDAGAATTTITSGLLAGDDVTITGAVADVGVDTALTINAGAANVDLANVTAGGAIAVTGTNIDLNGMTYTSTTGALAFTGAVDLDAAAATTTLTSGLGAGDTITFSAAVVDGGGDTALTLNTGAGNDLALAAAANDFSTVSITSGNNVTLMDATAIDLGASTISGTLAVTTAGAITDSGAVAVTGATTLAAGAANDITLNTAGNNFSTVSIGSANNVTLVDMNAINLGASTVSGALAVTSAGAMTDSGALAVTGATTLAAGAANDITLNTPTNDFIGAVTITSANNATLVDANAITAGTGGGMIAGTLDLTATSINLAAGSVGMSIVANAPTTTIITGGIVSIGGGAGTLFGNAANNLLIVQDMAIISGNAFLLGGDDTLQMGNALTGGATITGIANGGNLPFSTGTDALDYTFFPPPVSVDLTTMQATNIGGGLPGFTQEFESVGFPGLTGTLTVLPTAPANLLVKEGCDVFFGRPGDQIVRFMINLVDDLLGRGAVATTDIQPLVDLVNDQGRSFHVVRRFLFKNDEYLGLLATDMLQQAIYGSATTPPAAQVAELVAALRAGGTYEEVLARVIGSPEFLALAGGTPAGFVNRLFERFFTPATEPAGTRGLFIVMAEAGKDRVQLAREFLALDAFRVTLVDRWMADFFEGAGAANAARLRVRDNALSILRMRGTWADSIESILTGYTIFGCADGDTYFVHSQEAPGTSLAFRSPGFGRGIPVAAAPLPSLALIADGSTAGLAGTSSQGDAATRGQGDAGTAGSSAGTTSTASYESPDAAGSSSESEPDRAHHQGGSGVVPDSGSDDLTADLPAGLGHEAAQAEGESTVELIDMLIEEMFSDLAAPGERPV